MLDVPTWAWAVLAAVVVTMLAIDLLAHRGPHTIGFREAAVWSGVWVGISLVFAVVVALTLGSTAGVEFTTAWLLEKSLSVDNLFVFALIFGYFKVPRGYQHRVLFFGVDRGAGLPRHLALAPASPSSPASPPSCSSFAAILLYSAYKLLSDEDEQLSTRARAWRYGCCARSSRCARSTPARSSS